MKRLAVLVPAPRDADPESPEMRQQAENGAAKLASAWTTPEFVGSTEQIDADFPGRLPDGSALFRYECMAEPK